MAQQLHLNRLILQTFPLRGHHLKEETMTKTKNMAKTAIPVVLLTTTVIAAKRIMSRKNGKTVSEQLKEAAKNSAEQIDNAVGDLKRGITGKNQSQLEKSIDSMVESTKQKIDTVSLQLKEKLQQQKKRKRGSE